MNRPSFTIRDLFWLVLVVGMGCAWWVDRHGLSTAFSKSQSDLGKSQSQLARTKWRSGVLAKFLSEDGWEIDWNDPYEVVATKGDQEMRALQDFTDPENSGWHGKSGSQP